MKANGYDIPQGHLDEIGYDLLQGCFDEGWRKISSLTEMDMQTQQADTGEDPKDFFFTPDRRYDCYWEIFG